MAAPDDSALIASINSNLPDATPTQQRRITAGFLRSTLIQLVSWVKNAINSNLTTWLRTSDGQPGGANTDSIYREGSIEIRGGSVFRMRTPTNAAFGAVPFANQQGLQLLAINGGPAFLEFHLPGLCIHQLGVDTDGILKFHPWTNGTAYPILISGSSESMTLAATLKNRKVVLYQFADNDHQYYGFGINANALRYQVLDTNASHVFYAGSSPVTSNELMRIMGDGRVGIGVVPAIRTVLDVSGGWATFHGNIAGQTPGNGIGLSLGWNYSGGLAESNIVYGVQDWPNAFLNFSCWNGLVMSEKMRLDINGNLGIGTTTPAAKLSVSGPGHSQFRLENRYTPAGSGDANGAIGSICWDENYLYWKTSGGWKRSAFGSTF